MSVFGSSFNSGVLSQLNLRQNAMSKRTPKFVQYTNSRNAWIRMVSSVNVKESSNISDYYVLHGGTLYNNALRFGIGTSTQAYSTSALSGNHKLGVKPMPGITSVEIKSKSAYGSVREIRVNFNCWDIKQLEDLELIYMRLGYSVLVEWGWNTSLKNEDGDITSNIPSNVYKGVLNGSLNKEGIYSAIKNNSSTGNYDALYGKIQNYSWSARADGGYDCSVSIISLGEILQSLKINFNAATTSTSTSGLFGLKGPFPQDSLVAQAYNQNVLAGMMAELFTLAKDKIAVATNAVTKGDIASYTLLRYDIEVLAEQKTNSAFADQGGGGAQIYIALRDLITILNKYIILQENGKPIIELSIKDSGGNDLLCLGNILQLSVDPTVCLIKNPVWSDTSILNLPSEVKGLSKVIDNIPLNYWQGDYRTNSFAIIGNIYINLEYIYKLVTDSSLASQDKQEKNDIYAYDFLKNMMNGVSSAIGNVATFEVFTDPLSPIAQIVDINYHGTYNYESLPEIQVQNTKSIVRQYKLESQIFNDQATVIAIATQPEGGASIGANVTSLTAFNEGLKDRIIPAKVDSPSIPKPEDIEGKLKNIKENLSIIAKYTEEIKASWWESAGEFDAGEASKYANSLKDIIGSYKSLIADSGNNRAIIPTKLSLTMDGIGGMTIGNVFKIPESALPKRYREKKVAYIITGINHSIQNNDWTTTIEAQTLLMMPPKGFPLQAFINASVSISSALEGAVDKVRERISKFLEKKIQQAAQLLSQVFEEDPTDESDITSIPAGAGGNAQAMKIAGDAIFGRNGGAKGLCALYTFSIARAYNEALVGAPSEQLSRGRGNANDESYRNNLIKLGYNMTSLGVVTKNQLIATIENTKWNIGDIVNYRSITPTGEEGSTSNYAYRYGHTQIYTGGVLNSSKGSKWASSFGSNYGTGFVYGSRNSKQWELFVFRK